MKLSTRKLAVSSVMAALIFVITFSIRIPVPGLAGGAYLNLGDSLIYCAAFMLGGVPAMFAAGIGSMLADIAGGALIYAPATLVIKGLMGLACGVMLVKPSFVRFVFASIAGGAIMVAGYGIYELIVFGTAYALTSLPFNLIQWGGGVGIALLLYLPFSKMRRSYNLREDTIK
jgi:uncharacterized membrane protein